VPFVLTRAVLYFALWMAFAWGLNRWSREQDESGEYPAAWRLRALSAGGLVVYVLSMTFAGVDWVMSFEPHWYSTIFGFIIISGQGLSAVCTMIIVLAALARDEPVARVATPARFHDLGNLALVLLMVWAYVSFSQFLIIWSGNLPNEIPWYLHRTTGRWQWVLLLSRRTKRIRSRLARLAAVILVMRAVELIWFVAPEQASSAGPLNWSDLVAPVALGGIWVWAFIRALSSRPLLPRYGDQGAYEVNLHGEDHDAALGAGSTTAS
jgi:hypothetical protein